jgi:hypothetical protein
MSPAQFPPAVNSYPLSFDTLSDSFARQKMLSTLESVNSGLFLQTPGVWGTPKIASVQSATYSLFFHPLLTEQLLPTLPARSVPTAKLPHPGTAAQLSAFTMNTCRSISKQRVLSPCRMNTYTKPQGGGGVMVNHPSAGHSPVRTSALPIRAYLVRACILASSAKFRIAGRVYRAIQEADRRQSDTAQLLAPAPQHFPDGHEFLHQPRRRQFQKAAPIRQGFVSFLHHGRAKHGEIAPQLPQLLLRHRVAFNVLEPPRHNRAHPIIFAFYSPKTHCDYSDFPEGGTGSYLSTSIA